jgi:hypothetical protein
MMRPGRIPLLLIEEAIQLLRASPILVYALYSAGTVPFLLAFFSFCAEMSYDRNAGNDCAASAVAMALTYGWMKGLQAFCCRELVRVYTGKATRWWRPATMLAIWSRQITFQPFGLFIKPLAWLLIFPVTYVSAFFQNLTILGGEGRNDVRKSWEVARLWPKQSYAVYGLLSLLAVIVFFDLYAIVFSIPFLLKILLGIESFMTRSYTWAFSPVLLIAIAAITYFVIDLLAKAIEVIRFCEGESLTTGADLLRRLAVVQNEQVSLLAVQPQRATVSVHDMMNQTPFRVTGSLLQKRANRGRFAYSVCLLCGALLILMPLSAAASSVQTSASQGEPLDQRLTRPALDRQIERVLENPEYNWREKDNEDPASPHPRKASMVERWMSSIRQMLVSLGSWVRDLVKSLLRPFDLKAPVTQPETSRSSGLLNAFSSLLWVAFAGTLILFLIRIVKIKPPKLAPSIAPLQKPDLANEEIEADQLPDNEWYALAGRKMEAGEFRQAQRALFLAILSNLASHRFITVERWKSNTDYEKELGRKAKHLSELSRLFAESRLGFERCWYGAGTVTREDLETYNRIYQRIKHAAA